ncbi:MAG: Maf family protein [Bacillota bacterium]
MSDPGAVSCQRVPPLLLASASPRRKRILEDLGLSFECVPSRVDEEEILAAGEFAPTEAALILARAKAREVRERKRRGLIIGADTVVTDGSCMLGKPSDDDDARRMLLRLSGRSHSVTTAVCVIDADRGCEAAEVCQTAVRMKVLSPEVIEAYIATGEHRDKAGSYAIQGRGGLLVESIEGSHTCVVGFPVHVLDRLFARLGYSIWHFML